MSGHTGGGHAGGHATVSPSTIPGTLDVTGVVTAPAGFVGPLTGSVAGLGTIVDLATKAPIASPTFTGNVTIPTASVTTLSVGGIAIAVETRPTAFVADQTDFAGSGSTMFSTWTSDATPRTVNSRAISSGQWQIVRNGNTTTSIIIANNAAGTNKFLCPGAANYTLAAGKAVIMFYSAGDSKIQVMPFG